MMTDKSVLEWASGWVVNTVDDPTFRDRFLSALGKELRERSDLVAELRAALVEARSRCSLLPAGRTNDSMAKRIDALLERTKTQ